MKHLEIVVRGKVQGVYFRVSTKAVADQMGIKGVIRNQSDGSVSLEAEGVDFILDELINWCKKGPDGAEVQQIEVKEGTLKNYKNFEILKKK